MTTTPDTPMDDERLADEAAPLDALLVEAALGPLRRFGPDLSTAMFAVGLARRPLTTARRLGHLTAELARVGAGTSVLAPGKRDRRFADPAWTENLLLRRVVQAYLAAGMTADQLVGDAALGWQVDKRVRFLVENLADALSPSNVPLVNPASAKAAIDTAGLNFVRGGMSMLRDMVNKPRIPEMVDTSSFEVGRNLAVTPGAVVLRTEVIELIQYRPQTERVREVLLLIVPPTINKYHSMDLAPGRSLVDYLVQGGQQVFVISWRNPDARHADWGLDTYASAVIEALEAAQRVCGVDQAALIGACAGGIISSVAVAHLAATGGLGQLAAFGLFVTVLDTTRSGTVGALADRRLAAAAKAMSARRGYLDGRDLAEVFAWLRPDDLIWNYWVNNYLLGKKPPAVDILFWNADTTRMTAGLHRDFLELGAANAMVEPGGATMLGSPVDLAAVDRDSYIIAGITDHICPWQSCYRTTQLLGGRPRFLLSTSGHVAAMVNPPGNEKARYQMAKECPEDPHEWLRLAETCHGSWWPDYAGWLAERCGEETAAPGELGGGGLVPVSEAPGTYVYDH